MTKLIIVSPCYNEEAALPEAAGRISSYLQSLIDKGVVSADSHIIYVNDGSKDSTWNIITQLHKDNPLIKGFNLAHNVGHQNAIMAGMMEARSMCDAIITMDCDLQDDINAIEEMLKKYEAGADIVYGVKVSREADSWKKKTSAQLYYKLLESMGVETVYNHADFRLMSRRALEALAAYPERNLYLRGMITSLGFNTATVDDVLSPRMAGESKYTLRKMLRLAGDGITSFSTRPIELIITVGLLMLLIAFGMFAYVLVAVLLGKHVAGWASIMMSLWFIGAFVTIGIGIIGTYIGKIYIEVKQRPMYIIADKV